MKIFFTTLLFFLFLSELTCGQNINNNSPYKFSDEIYNQIKSDSNFYWKGGIASSDLSFIGLYKEALAEYDKPRKNIKIISKSDSLDFLNNYAPIDAKKFIIQKAKENQVIIFNEAHYNPRNRVFITSLLKDLKNAGYNYFAVETFTNDSTFSKGKHPNLQTGYYTMEPEFGNLVREALNLGFLFFPYEDTTGARGKEREVSEAKNIASLFKKEPNVKVIIYCGFDHIFEDSIPNWGKTMAGRLKEFTGIDPYTVDQVILSEKSAKNIEDPYYKLIHSDSYSIMVDKDGHAFNNHKVDALLYSPPSKYIYNRPNWIFENNKMPYFLHSKDIHLSFPILIKAYLTTDDLETSVPIDVIEIKNEADISTTAIALFKKGHFVINLVNKNGEKQTFFATTNESHHHLIN